MDEEVVKLIIGALLHDIGKVIYRQGQVHGRHSEIGYEFLKNNLKYRDKEIMESVRYHHGNELSKAKIDDNSMAYITYIADNIAAAADRRNRDEISINNRYEYLSIFQRGYRKGNKHVF